MYQDPSLGGGVAGEEGRGGGLAGARAATAAAPAADQEEREQDRTNILVSGWSRIGCVPGSNCPAVGARCIRARARWLTWLSMFFCGNKPSKEKVYSDGNISLAWVFFVFNLTIFYL